MFDGTRICAEWCGTFDEKLIIAQMINIFPALYGIRTFIPVVTKFHHFTRFRVQ
jgi:hypothetical protein